MSGSSSAHEIGIVDYPGAQVACIQGLTDLFGIACTIALDQRRSGRQCQTKCLAEPLAVVGLSHEQPVPIF